jgi:hypothetical protein
LQGAHSTQTFISQRIARAENSAELPPEADTLTSEVTKVLAAKPGIECVAIVGAIAAGEPPGFAEQRAKNVRYLLGAHGVSLARLLTLAQPRRSSAMARDLPNPIRLSGSRRRYDLHRVLCNACF